MNKVIRSSLLYAAIILLLLPSAALAGGKATVVTSSQPIQAGGRSVGGGSHTMSVTWHDVNTLRMAMDGQPGYLIMREGKAYSVTQVAGQTQVMDMAALRQMMQSMGRKNPQNKSASQFGSIDSVEATGDDETVAGIKGRVYNVTWTEPDGTRKSGKAVLTDDPLVVEMTRAYLGSVGALFGSGNTQSFLKGLPDEDRGLLRVGDSFRVRSISRADPSASVFELPAKPMDMQSLMGGMGRGAGQ